MPEMVTEICGVHQVIENLVGMMADQRRVEGQPQVTVAALTVLERVQILPSVK